MHFTFTDLVDGVTDESVEGARGRRAQRPLPLLLLLRQLQPSAAWSRRRATCEPEISPEEMDMLVLKDDEDGDGVADFNDLSRPARPPARWSIPAGCPLTMHRWRWRARRVRTMNPPAHRRTRERPRRDHQRREAPQGLAQFHRLRQREHRDLARGIARWPAPRGRRRPSQQAGLCGTGGVRRCRASPKS